MAGDKTFEFTLGTPTLQVENLFSLILPRHQIEGTDFATAYDQTGWLSCGPFRIDSWQPGQSLRLVRNDNYWKTDPETGERLPYLDSLVVRFYPDQAALLEAFRGREVQAITLPEDVAIVEEIRQLEAEGALVDVVAGPTWEHLAFQFGENNPNVGSLNAHLDFRRAVAYLIDREAIAAQGFWESEQPLDSILALTACPPTIRGPSPGATRTAPARCWTGCAPTWAGIASLNRRPWCTRRRATPTSARPSGVSSRRCSTGAAIRATVDPKDSAIFFGAGYLDGGGWDLAGWAWMATPGPAGVLQTLSLYDPELPPPEGEKYSRWGTPAVSGEISYLDQGPSRVRDAYRRVYARLLDEMRTTADHDRFAALAREAENVLADQVFFIPRLTGATLSAVWADEIAGYGYSTWLDTWDIETWRRANG